MELPHSIVSAFPSLFWVTAITLSLPPPGLELYPSKYILLHTYVHVYEIFIYPCVTDFDKDIYNVAIYLTHHHYLVKLRPWMWKAIVIKFDWQLWNLQNYTIWEFNWLTDSNWLYLYSSMKTWPWCQPAVLGEWLSRSLHVGWFLCINIEIRRRAFYSVLDKRCWRRQHRSICVKLISSQNF